MRFAAEQTESSKLLIFEDRLILVKLPVFFFKLRFKPEFDLAHRGDTFAGESSAAKNGERFYALRRSALEAHSGHYLKQFEKIEFKRLSKVLNDFLDRSTFKLFKRIEILWVNFENLIRFRIKFAECKI